MSRFFVETRSGSVLDGFSRHNLAAASDCILFISRRRNGRLDGNTCGLKLSLTVFMLSEKLHLTLFNVCFETYGSLVQEKNLILHHVFQYS